MRYQNLVHHQGEQNFDNVFYFSGGYVGQNGFLHRNSCPYNFAIGIEKREPEFLTNIPGLVSNSSQEFRNFLFAGIRVPQVAVWYVDAERQTYLARDLFGTIPLFYIHIPNTFFAFSTSLPNLAAMPEVRKYLEIDEKKIEAFGSRRHPRFYRDASSTFFSNIKCALPGHLYTVSPDKVVASPYISFDTDKWSSIKDPRDYSPVLKDLFREAVRKTGTHCGSIMGSHLSGGLDSSSVSSMLRDILPTQPLHTFHMASLSAEADESEYAKAVARHISSTHHHVNQSQQDFAMLRLSTVLYAEPEASFLSPASNLLAISVAREAGCGILLNGFGGDSIIGSGLELMQKSLQDRDWVKFESLLRMRVKYFPLAKTYKKWDSYSFNRKYELVLQNFLYRPFSTLNKKNPGNIIRLYREIAANVHFSYPYFLKRAVSNFLHRLGNTNIRSESTIFRQLSNSDIHPAEDDIHFPDSIRGSLPLDYKVLFDDVFHPYAIKTQEQYFTLSDHYNVANLSPFMNKELLELCMVIPDEVKFGDGIGRAHFRDAMKGIIPDEVYSRGSKSTLSSADGYEMTMRLYEQSKELLFGTQEVWDYVDQKKFQEQIKIAYNSKIPHYQKSNVYFHITRTISLAVWLDWLAAFKRQ